MVTYSTLRILLQSLRCLSVVKYPAKVDLSSLTAREFGDIPARLAENVNDTAPIFDPTAKANIPPVPNFGGIPGRSAKFGCRRILTRRIVAPMLVPETLQRMTLITPTTKTVA